MKFAKNTYADIRFSKVIKPKEGISMPPIDLYQFNEICIVKFGTREKVYPEEAYIEFRVEKSWINEGGYSFDDIAMFRWNNESREWEELKTEFVNQDESFAYYKAYMQGFSLFAIGVKVKQPEVIPTATPTVKPTVTPALTPTPKPTAKPAATPTLTPTTTPTLKPWWQIPGFEVIFALVAIAVAYLVRR